MARRDQRGEIHNPRVFDEACSWSGALAAADSEIHRVLEVFGPQSLSLFDWMSILGEEYGELCKAVNDFEFGTEAQGGLGAVYDEAVQVAAVAAHVAAIVRESEA